MCCQYESGTTVGQESKESNLHRTDLTQLLSFRGRSWNSESRFLAGSVSKRARDKWRCETSPIAISVWWSYLLIHATQWMSGFTGVTSYFSSQVDNTRVVRETGWNHSILKFPHISKLFLENLQTQTGLSKDFINPGNWKAQEFSRSLVDAMRTEFLFISLLSAWWIQSQALHGGLWHSTLT